MNGSVAEKLRSRVIERKRRRKVGKLSARTLTAVVFVVTTLYWVWALAQPNPPTISILAQSWTGVAIFSPLIALVISSLLLFGYSRSDPREEIWAYLAVVMTVSMWIFFFVRPHETPPPGWGNP